MTQCVVLSGSGAPALSMAAPDCTSLTATCGGHLKYSGEPSTEIISIRPSSLSMKKRPSVNMPAGALNVVPSGLFISMLVPFCGLLGESFNSIRLESAPFLSAVRRMAA